MPTRIENSGRALSDADISEVEHRLGTKLPDSYRQFLLRHNGGSPVPDGFRIPPNDASTLQAFCEIDARKDNRELDVKARRAKGRIPSGLLPIAWDDGGNKICIGLDGERLGRIYFWDHEFEEDEPTWNNVTELAENLDEFLDGLFE